MKSYNARFFIKFGAVIAMFLGMFMFGRISVIQAAIFN